MLLLSNNDSRNDKGRFHVASKDEKEAKATRDAQLIALRMVAVVGLVVAAAVALDAKEETPRFDDGWGDARAEWGAALAPLLFAVAGFTAALKHADTAADDEVPSAGDKDDT